MQLYAEACNIKYVHKSIYWLFLYKKKKQKY